MTEDIISMCLGACLLALGMVGYGAYAEDNPPVASVEPCKTECMLHPSVHVLCTSSRVNRKTLLTCAGINGTQFRVYAPTGVI